MSGHGSEAGLERGRLFVGWVLEPWHPDSVDGNLSEDVAATAKAGDVIGMSVRHDNEREMIVAVLGHLGDGRAYAAEILRVHTAIDQDVACAGLARHAEQEEVAEADAIHAHAQAAGRLDQCAALRRSIVSRCATLRRPLGGVPRARGP